MSMEINRLSASDLMTKPPGKYCDGGGVWLNVRDTGARALEFIYKRGRFGEPNKSTTLGLGSLPCLDLNAARATLKIARAKRDVYRELLQRDIDPQDHKKQEERAHEHARLMSQTFFETGDEYIKFKSKHPNEKYCWKKNTEDGHRARFNNHLKPLFKIPLLDITPRQVADILLGLLAAKKPSEMHNTRLLGQAIWDWAGTELPIGNKINPFSLKGQLRKLLSMEKTDPDSDQQPALDHTKIQALYAKLEEFKPRDFYTAGEAARKLNLTREAIYHAIDNNRLLATKSEVPIFPANFLHWEIDPVELAKYQVEYHHPTVVEVIPGLASVSGFLLRYLMLCASRFNEVAGMRWPEYHEKEGVWIIPWQRLPKRKLAKKHSRLDHHLPLSKPAIEILCAMREQQKCDDFYDPKNGFVFGNYRTYNPASARMGVPPARSTVRNLLRRKVSAEDADKTLHGMRRTFGGWARDLGYPESDIERALTHIKGYGETDLARIYSGHAKREVPLARLFNAWAIYCQTGVLPKEITLLRTESAQIIQFEDNSTKRSA